MIVISVDVCKTLLIHKYTWCICTFLCKDICAVCACMHACLCAHTHVHEMLHNENKIKQTFETFEHASLQIILVLELHRTVPKSALITQIIPKAANGPSWEGSSFPVLHHDGWALGRTTARRIHRLLASLRWTARNRWDQDRVLGPWS